MEWKILNDISNIPNDGSWALVCYSRFGKKTELAFDYYDIDLIRFDIHSHDINDPELSERRYIKKSDHDNFYDSSQIIDSFTHYCLIENNSYDS